RLGVLREEFEATNDPDIAGVFREALSVLKTHGVILEEVKLDDYPYQDIARCTMNVEASCIFEDLWKSGKIDMMLNKQRAIDWSAARMLPATDYLKIQRVRTEVCNYANRLFKRYDALVAPSAASAAGFLDPPTINTA